MRNKLLILLMTVCLGLLLCQPLLALNDLNDLNGHWAQDHLKKWVDDGLITGYPDGQFKPDNVITRAEFVALVNRAFNIPNKNATYNFSDVKPADWFYADVMSGKDAGYIAGYPDGTFNPYSAITRQEAAVLITTLLGLSSEDERVVESFNDYQRIDNWAKSSVNRVVAHGIVSGFPDKTFRAQNNITRAETVVILEQSLAYSKDRVSGIKGVVKLGNQPVKGAAVRIYAKDPQEVLKETVTGDDGSFTFMVPDGEYEITAVQDKNVGYASWTMATGARAAEQEILLSEGARVNGRLLNDQGKPLANIPLVFTTNPSFGGNTNNNGEFSIVLPLKGNDGQVLSYDGYFFHNGTRAVFVTNQQFNGDANLGQVRTDIPGQAPSGGGGSSGGGGGGGTPNDTTPPVWALTYPKTADIIHTGLKLLFNADESGIAYCVVLADNATPPTAAEVKSGTGSGGSAAAASGQQALSANTEANAAISGLTAATPYDIYAVAEDSSGNLQASPVKLEETTAAIPADTTPPEWVLDYPKTTDITINGFTLRFNANEGGNAFYVVLADNATVPTAAEVRNCTGSGDAAAITSGHSALQGNIESSILVHDLTAGTAYDIYVIAEDSFGNLQASPEKREVTTTTVPDTSPPSWAADYPKTADITQTNLGLLAKTNESGTAYYVVLTDGAADPSAVDVKNGTGAFKHGQITLQADTEAQITITGLTAGTAYDIYVVAEDAVPNLQASPAKLDVTTGSLDPGDNTPPSWAADYPKTADISTDGFKLLFNADENGTAYYVVLADGAAPPSALEVKSGTGSGGNPAVASGQQALSANTETNAAISGLTAGTPYDIYVVAEDGSGNLQAGAVMRDVTTASPTDPPPAWAQSYPSATSITESGLNLLLKANKAGKAYYVVLNHGAIKPDSSQVKAGTDSQGSTAKSGQQSLQANTQAAASVTGLASGTTYDIYVVAEDNDQNLQASPTLIIRTTLVPDTAPPGLKYAAVNSADLELTFDEKIDPTSLPGIGDFSVSTGQAASISSVVVSGAKVNITMAEAVKSGDTVTVSYTPGEGPIRDEAGNNVPAFANRAVVNHTAVMAPPPIDFTVATSVFASTDFLYSGDNPVQTGVNQGTIEQKRAAVLRGKVLANDRTPLPGARITIVNHDEFGQTLSRADGQFDMAVNGGGVLTVRYEKEGFITAQRTVNVPWEDFAHLPEVVLIPYDSKATAINLNAGQMQVAQGSQITDQDGARQATLIIPAGVTAQTEAGTPISDLTIRATEYTVGNNGPQAMPAELPLNVGYTYCVEYSADEAENVTFDQPIFHYVENFIGAPVGGIVPMGYYDYDQAAWIPSENGRVIKILGINNGLADLDLDGTGVAADAAALTGLGVTEDEQRKLATLYGEGQELWRVPITHFTPWDCNWPYGPPLDADRPNLPLPRVNNEERPCTGSGSVIEYQNQVLGETSKVWGTSFTLNYRSSRVEGNKNIRSLQIPITLSEVHPDLKRVELEVYIAGRVFTKTFPPENSQIYVFTWDGKDAYGRTTQGSAPVYVRIKYVYPAVYLNPAPLDYSFSESGRSPEGWASDRDNLEATISQEWQGKISRWDSSPVGLGGWTLDVHHAYDPLNQVLNLGDGSRREVGSNVIISTVAGLGGKDNYGFDGDGSPASESRMRSPSGVTMAPDGSLYIADSTNNRIRKIDPDGIITTVAGSFFSGDFSGDSGPATQARLNSPVGVALGPDGSLYLSDYYNNRVRRVSPDGIITTVAGIGISGYSGDGGPASNAKISAKGIAVGPDGSLYIADNSRIRRVNPNGIITTVAGNGTAGYSGDGGPAADAQLKYPSDVAVAPDGSLYIADTDNHCIRRVGPDGIITTVAGTYSSGYSGDDGPAVAAGLRYPTGVAVGPDGSLYIADRENNRIRQVAPTGTITTVAGNGTEGYSGDGGLASSAQLFLPDNITVGLDGSLYIADTVNHCIRRVGQPLLSNISSNSVISAEDGSELFLLDAFGRHQSTVNALTGSTVYAFTYDEQGRLEKVEDAFGNITEIQRDGEGNPTAIVAPGGQTTYLAINENGYLSSIQCPLLKETALEYTSDGLLTKLTDHKGNIHRFTYDELGRLVKDEDPAGGYTELLHSSNNYMVEVKTAEGLVSTYQVEYLPGSGTRRVDTDPFGGVTTTETLADGTSKVTYPDGTKVTLVEGPDPRVAINMQAPITREFTVTTPGGLSSTVTRERTVTMDNPEDLLSVTQISDTVTNNGEIYTTTYDIDRDGPSPTVTVTATTPEGRRTVSTIDAYGRLIEEKNGDLEPVKYTYGDKGHLTTVEQGNQRVTYTYDDMNRIADLEDAAGDKFQYAYNGADLLTGLTMPGGQTYAFAYDVNGNATEITMPSGDKHQLDYTVVELPQSYNPPGNGAYQKSYNRDRAVIELTLPGGRQVAYQYDAVGRVTGMQYDSTTATFGYGDNTDRVTGIQRNPDGISYSFGYDGSLPTSMTVSGSVNGNYNYAYDNDFRLIQSTFGADDMTLTYDRDGLAAEYGPFSITRNHSFGLPTEISDGVMTATYSYDSFGRMTDRIHRVNGQQVYHLGLGYDNTGLISQKNETADGSVNIFTYTYDDNKQLMGVAGNTPESYTYDENGNRLSDGAAYDAQDRLTNLGGVAYQFNEDGFLTQKGNDTFEYTAQGELVKATLASGSEVSYTYDGLGRRVARWVKSGDEPPALTEQYLYGNPGNPFEVTAVRDNSGTVSQYYYDQVNCLFAIKQGAAWYYVAADQQGTPRVVTDADGQVVKVMEYDSFGKLRSDSNPDLRLPIGYAGGIADPETGVVHFGMRDYDPAAGRWTARDPILFNGQQGNLYVYVSNNPVNLRDPYGLFCIGGSAYAGIGIGGQLCITGEGVSLCGEVGFGVGGGVEIAPLGGLARTGTSINASAEATYLGVGPSVGLSLDDCGSLQFVGALKAGPFTQAASYDFLAGKWNLGDLSVGGEKSKMNSSWAESFKPKMSASAKISGQGCVRF